MRPKVRLCMIWLVVSRVTIHYLLSPDFFPAPPLKLIDLPGLDQRIMDDSTVNYYVEHNDAILLVIVPAAQVPEISSSRARPQTCQGI
ncbi:hypothetical protein HHK36_020123 [Tetracentron sinense]|uniref:Uncharacterized protein n=1 Tax=Tetracentron sinense TaxID=13715 RepID=A0A834YYF5_TETSI|nr:hypothetical protein HHK36_020123 [Tetracentron sinense]